MDLLNDLIGHWSFAEFLSQASLASLLVVMATAIAVLVKGADWAIEGAVELASRLQLPRIVIGATILSLGTTMPEMFVSVMAAWMGQPGLALGNGVGSIICDTGLIFALMCVMGRMPLDRFILNRTGWVQVGAATLLVVISLAALLGDARPPMLGRWVGILFLLLLALYMYASYRWAKESNNHGEDPLQPTRSLPASSLLLLFGLGGVIIGSRTLVPCAAECAYRVGVPEDIVAATLVAFGTSVPELITALSACRKGHPEIMIGNVVGADVLNCLFVIGAAAAARPLAIPSTFYTFHFPAMLIILYSFRAFIFMDRKGYFRRWQGAWLLTCYALYLVLQYAFNFGTAG